VSESASAGGPIAGIRRRWNDLASRPGFRVSVAALFSIAILAVATFVYREAAYLDRFSEAVPDILREANLVAKDAAALELTEKGTVTFEGRVVGSESIARQMASLYSVAGELERTAEVTSLLLGFARPEWLPTPFADEPWLVLGAAALLLAIVNFAVFSGLAGPLVGVTLLCTAIALPLTLLGRPSLAISLAAVPLGLLAFAIVIRGALAALDWASPVFAIACGVVREAMRLKIAIAFAAIAIVAIPLFPQWIDPQTPLRYQVQTFLARSMAAMYVVCAFLTVFLGCATVAFEIRDRQAWLTLTKPVSRFSYLVGKWLGLVVLNATLLATASLAVYVFLLDVRGRTPKDVLDALAVEDEVLVARVGVIPGYAPMPPDELRTAVEEAIRADPNSQADIRDDPSRELEIKKQLARTIGGEFIKRQRSIAPGDEREYRFSGLGDAREAGANLTLRYKFYSGESDPNLDYPALFVFGEGDSEYADYRKFVAAQANVVPVPANAIAPDGTLRLRVVNVRVSSGPDGEPVLEPTRASIAFDVDGLELLYRVGGFTDNLLRAQLVNLLKLSFLGMLSVACAAILSFPVACLVVFTVFAAGSVGPYLATSVAEYQIRSEGLVVEAFESSIKAIAGATEFAVRSFGEARANGPLVEGRLVSWGLVARTFLVIGVAWSGILLLVGWMLFRRKELAIYSGQGG